MPKGGSPWDIEALKEHFDTIRELYDERINRLEAELVRDFDDITSQLDGFPEEYANHKDLTELRAQIEVIRSDHVQRREHDELRDSIEDIRSDRIGRREFSAVQDELSAQSGRRTTFVGVIAVVVTIFGIASGVIWKQQLTHSQVSEQIKIESPWLADRATIEHEIATLQASDLTLRIRVSALETLERTEKHVEVSK